MSLLQTVPGSGLVFMFNSKGVRNARPAGNWMSIRLPPVPKRVTRFTTEERALVSYLNASEKEKEQYTTKSSKSQVVWKDYKSRWTRNAQHALAVNEASEHPRELHFYDRTPQQLKNHCKDTSVWCLHGTLITLLQLVSSQKWSLFRFKVPRIDTDLADLQSLSQVSMNAGFWCKTADFGWAVRTASFELKICEQALFCLQKPRAKN